MVNCRLGGNVVGDDTANLANSQVEVTDCIFESAPMDALDLDGCTGIVERCQFIDAGNDGLDVMECELDVVECHFFNCGDKGLSIGEECRITVSDSRFENCLTGLELKDASRTRVVQSDIVNCQTGVRAYRKKWLFRTGGFGQLRECRFSDCPRDLDLDAHSQIWLDDTDASVSVSQQGQVHSSGVFHLGDGPSVRPLSP